MVFKQIVKKVGRLLFLLIFLFFVFAFVRYLIIEHENILDTNPLLTLYVSQTSSQKCLYLDCHCISDLYCEEAWWNDTTVVFANRVFDDEDSVVSLTYTIADISSRYIESLSEVHWWLKARQDFSTLEELNVELKKRGLGKSNLKHRGYLFRKYRDDLIFDD